MEVSGQPHTLAALPLKNELLVHTEWKAGRVPHPVRRVLKRATSPVVARIQTADPSAHSLVSVLTPLFELHFCVFPHKILN
jgi:hypothetical protein